MATQKHRDKEALLAYRKKIELIRSGEGANPYETTAEKKERINIFRKDYAAFVNYYFPHYATSQCADFHIKFANKVKRNKTFKGFAEWGRGLAKSVHLNIMIPFWLFINEEPIYMVIIGNNHDKAKTLLDDLQAELEANPRIINDFGKQMVPGDWESGDFRTASGFMGKALGMGQSVRGLRKKAQRPNYIVMDDCEDKQLIKNPKRQDETVQWVEKDLIPTMDGSIRRFSYANNRFAPEMIQTKLQQRHPNWFVHHIKAYNNVTFEPIWKAKYNANYYRILESEIGTLAARAEFNHEPHVEGKIFTDDMIQWGKIPALNHFIHITGHWDVAYAGTTTADYNAVRVWGLHERDFWMINCFLKQSKMKAALQWMADFQMSLPKTVIVHWAFEAQFWNDEVIRTIEEVEREFGITLNLVKVDRPTAKKYDRMLSLHPYYQNGRIYYNDKLQSHNDTQLGLAQLKGIEPGYNCHDDAPDADEQAIKRLSKYIKMDSSFKPVFGKRKRRKSY